MKKETKKLALRIYQCRISSKNKIGSKKSKQFFCLLSKLCQLIQITANCYLFTKASTELLKTNYGSETVIPLCFTSCWKKIYSESAVIAKRRRLIRAIYTAGDIKRYHRLRTVISLVSGFFLMLCAC